MQIGRNLFNTPQRIARAAVITALSTSPATGLAANAGLMQWSFEHHNSTVPVAVWYPTDAAETAMPAGPFTLTAASNSDIAAGQHPLVVLSHGTGGSNIAHHTLAEALARTGFMVAALEHPGDNFQDRSLISDTRYFEERPRQINALLNALAADSALMAKINPARVGAIGHSAGGYAVAAAIGATPDRAALATHCQTAADDPSCKYAYASIGVTGQSATPFRLPTGPVPTDSVPALSIRSAVLLAPLGSVISPTSRMDDTVPVHIIAGELDDILPARYHVARYQQIAPHATVEVAAGAGHFSFIAPVVSAWHASLGEVATDPPGFDRSAFSTQLGHQLSAWFHATLN